MKSNDKKIPPRKAVIKNIKRLLSYIFARHKLRLVFVFICILIGILANIAGSLFLQTLIDDYIGPLINAPEPFYGNLLKAIAIMGMIYMAGITATYIYNRIMVGVGQGVLKDIRDTMFDKMQTLPVRYFDTHTHGDVMSRYTNDTDTLRQMISVSLPQMVSSVITIGAVFITMLAANLYLALVVLISVFFTIIASRKIASKSSKYFKEQQAALGKANGYMEEMIHGQKVIKVFNHENQSKNDFDRLNDSLCDSSTKANRFANIMAPVMGNLGHLQYVLIAIAGGIMSAGGTGGITLGIIAAFLNLSRTFSMPLSQVSQQINSIIMALAGADRIFELMDEQPETDEGCVTLDNIKREGKTHQWVWKQPNQDGSYTYTPLKGDVRFYDVDFSYDGKKLVLKNISLYAKPGHKVAFVGSTGAGKTTITNLLNRFYDVADGKVRYDDININDIKKSDLRRSLGMVLQDTTLFSGTVRDNIRYGKLDATDEEVIDAAKRANAHDFISMLPEGYDTLLSGDGSDLSQGQRQLISIARAEIADTPVMILDEATSSIDTRTESIVQKGMDALMKDRTVFVIAHRLSTVRNSNVIMVLEDGKIIERGTHEALLKEKGTYYNLYTGAFVLE